MGRCESGDRPLHMNRGYNIIAHTVRVRYDINIRVEEMGFAHIGEKAVISNRKTFPIMEKGVIRRCFVRAQLRRWDSDIWTL